MAEGTVDNLNIQLSADADQAVKSLNSLASTLRSINTAFTKDISGMRKFSKEIGTMTSALRGLNNIKVSAPDLSKISKAMKDLGETKTSGAKNTANDVKDIIDSLRGLGNVNFNESGITKLTNSLRRLTNVDLSTFDASKFRQITESISSLGNMPDVSSGVNRFVSSLSRLANAGTKTGQSANDILRLGEQTRLAAQKLQSVGAINDDVNLFVQSIGRLASAGSKTGQTASGLNALAKETIEFFKAMQNAPKVSENTIRMTQALAQLATAGGKVGTATNTVTSSFSKLASSGNKTLSTIKKVSNGIVSAFKNIGGASGNLTKAQFSLSNLLKTAIGFRLGYGLLNFGKQAFEFGSDITEVENVVDVSFGKMSDMAYEFASTAEEQFGISELSALKFSGTLMAMFNSSGITQEKAAEMSTALTGLAGDLASFYNISQEDAFTKIRAGMSGQVMPLRQLGIDMTVASMSAYAMSQGITKSWQSMTQGEKQLLRYQYLLSVTSQQQGDFARTSWSWANQTRLLTLNLQSLAATLGQGLISAVLPAVTALNKLFEVLQKAALAVRNFFYVLTGYKGGAQSGVVDDMAGLGDTAEDLGDIGSAGSDAADGLGDAAKAAEELKNATLGIDELNIISPNEPASTGGSGGSGGSGVGGTGGDIGLDDALFDDGDKDPEKYVSPWAQRIRDAFLAEDWEGLGEEIAWGLNKGLQKVYDVISWDNVGPKITEFTSAFSRTFNSLVDNIDWNLLGRTVGAGINTVVNTLNQFITGINWKNLGRSFASGIMGIVNEVNWRNLGTLIGNKFMISWNILFGFIENLDFSKIGTSIATGFNGAVQSIDLGTIGASISKTVSGIVTMFSEFAREADWSAVGISISDGINNFLENFDFAGLASALNEWVDGLKQSILKAISNIKWDDIFSGISDFIGNLELDTAFLIAIPAILKFRNALKKINIEKYTRNFTKFKNLFKGNFFGNLKTSIANISGNLTKLQKAAIGVVSVFTEFSMVKDGFYDLTLGTENFVGSIAKISASAGIASAALYTAFGPAGIAVGAITGLTAAVMGFAQALSEREEMELYGDTVENITSKINENSDALKKRAEESANFVETAGLGETAMAKDLADKYFNLAQKEGLSNDEKEEMKRISQLLIEQFPDLKQYYNEQTGLIDATRQTVDDLIESRLNEIKMSAAEEQLTQAYKDQYDALQNVKTATDNVNTALDEMNDLQDKYDALSDKRKLVEEYEELSEKIGRTRGDTSELIDEQNRLWNEITENGKHEEYLGYDYLTQQMKETEGKINSVRDDYNDFISTLSDAQGAYDDIQANIDNFTGMLTEGFTSAGEDGGAGAAKGLSDSKDILKESSKLLAEAGVEGYAEGQDSHSPSKKYMQLAGDAISGLIKGTNINAPFAIAAMQALALKIASSFGEAIVSSMKKTASSIPTYFTTAWVGVTAVFSSAPVYFSSIFTQSYNSIKTAFQFMDSWFREKWNNTKKVFNDVQNFFKTTFKKGYDSVKNVWSGLDDFFEKEMKNAFSPIEDMINGIIKGVNWVLKEVDSDTRLSEWRGVAFKRGSDGVPRNMMGVVNDQRGATYRELIVPPNGKAFIPKGRNVMMPLQKGTKIMPADETKEFLKGFSKLPHFAKGIGSLFGWNEKYSGDMFDYLDKPDAITKIALDKFVDVSGLSDLWRNMAKGIARTTFDSISEFIGTIFEKTVPKVDYNPSAGVEQWRDLAKYALKLTDQYTEANLDRLLMQMQSESGGNPNAINNWDINAKNGTPSKGLMQVIDPTFRAYAYPGYSKNIYDPLSNILAAIRYTLSRYGSLANGWKGHGYASGIGKISLSDLFGKIPALAGGGTLMPGQLFVANERGPELIGRYGNRTTVMNNDQVVESVSFGVEKAVERQNAEMTALLRQILETNQRILSKDTSNYIDGKRADSLLRRARSNSGYNFRPAGGTV